MNTNWRSVEGMVKAYNRLFYGAPVASNTPTDVFGFDIKYNPVEFTPKAAAAKTPLRDPAAQRSAMNYVSLCLEEKENTNIMRRKMAQWIAQEIYRLLNEAQFQLDNGETKPVKPQDIAILVKDRTEAGAIKNVLQQKGLACVYLSDRSNLFASAEAKDVLRLLNGIWHANDTSNVLQWFCSQFGISNLLRIPFGWKQQCFAMFLRLWRISGMWRIRLNDSSNVLHGFCSHCGISNFL